VSEAADADATCLPRRRLPGSLRALDARPLTHDLTDFVCVDSSWLPLAAAAARKGSDGPRLWTRRAAAWLWSNVLFPKRLSLFFFSARQLLSSWVLVATLRISYSIAM